MSIAAELPRSAPHTIKTIAVVLGNPSASPLHLGPAIRPITRKPWIITIRAGALQQQPAHGSRPILEPRGRSQADRSAYQGAQLVPGSLSAFGCWLIASLEPAKSRCVASRQ